MRPILVGCPVRERAWILPRYLAHLEALGRLRPEVRYHFVVQPSADRTEEIIASWCAVRPEASWGRATGAPAGWRREAGPDRYNYAWLAAMRNVLAEQAVLAGADLLSIDSDVLAPPALLSRLDGRLDVCAALLSNTPGLPAGDPMAAPNGEPENALPEAWRAMLSGPVRVRWTGACCRYRREVLLAGVRWHAHPRGEDVAFCTAARVAGFSCFLDGSVRVEHVMTEPQGR